MQNPPKIWDHLSQKYFKNFNDNNIELEAVENLYFAWPVFKKFIQKNVKNIKDKRVLDFGCGTGQICAELHSLGFTTTGIDYSQGMIKIAKKNIDPLIHLHLGNSKKAVAIAKKEGPFDLIISILVFPFIEDIEQTIKDLHSSLTKGGYLCFAVFNEKWVREGLKNGVDYEQPPKSKGIKKLIFNFGENRKTDVFPRSAKEYDKIFATLGYKKLLEKYPLFTSKFIKKVYPKMPQNISEFMILGYKKP
ncbi:MAG: class I SAM-dependent methyltransferase [Candidatus Gracilibacteria bacterium]